MQYSFFFVFTLETHNSRIHFLDFSDVFINCNKGQIYKPGVDGSLHPSVQRESGNMIQPNRQNKCWQSKFLHFKEKFKLKRLFDATLCFFMVIFFLSQSCAYALVRFNHKKIFFFYVSPWNTCYGCQKHGWRWSQGHMKNIRFCCHKHGWQLSRGHQNI